MIATRTVTIGGPHRLGVALKLGAAALIGAFLAAETALPPVGVAAGLAAVLVGVVYAEKTLTGRVDTAP